MNLSDKITIKKVEPYQDENLDWITQEAWQEIGKCVIFPNSAAQSIMGKDGQIYLYSYQVVFRKPKDMNLIPREDDVVHITKKDGTIDTDGVVHGFVTLKNWVKIWL